MRLRGCRRDSSSLAWPEAGPHRKGPILSKWQKFPKLELHLHVEGAAPPDLVRRLGKEQGVSLEGLFDAKGRYASSDFTTFLKAYETMAQVFFSPESYHDLMMAVLKEQADNGVIYTEVFISPPSIGMDEEKWLEVLAAKEEGANRAEAKHGIICRFIPLAIRHHGAEEAMKAVKAILRAPRGRMRGFGLAGDERAFACSDFTPAFRAMSEAGFELTAHAGEFGGPESVRAALDDLGVSRLGHGVRAAEDAELVRRLAAEGVTLETCPGSNIALGVYPDLKHHPIDDLRRAGCKVTVSTDDPPFFWTDMTSEYDNLSDCFGYGAPEYEEFARNALEGAFCEPEVKTLVGAKLEELLASHRH